MIILIKDPGSVRSTQTNLQCYRNIYRNASTRLSNIDRTIEVLDVRLPLVSSNPLPPGDYRVIEGHTRFYEATKRGVGIEAELINSETDILKCPKECFAQLSIESCVSIFLNLNFYQMKAQEEGVIFIRDLLS